MSVKNTDPIIITGASRRIGLYIANTLLRDGYKVIAHCRSKTADIQKLEQAGAYIVYADLNIDTEVMQLAENIKTNFGSLRAIIHNASAFTPTSKNIQDAIQQYKQFFHVHMLAPYLLNELLQPLLSNTKNDFADIIHITDINVERPNPAYDIYSSTKAGLANLTKSFARRFAPKIKVNSIAPGPVLFPEEHSEKSRKQILNKTPLNTEGGADAIYTAIICLLTHRYMTGTTLTVDGGRSLVD